MAKGDRDPTVVTHSTQRGARAVALLAIAELVGKISTLALLVYAVRVLAPEEFGAFSYALAFGLLLAALPAWGLDALLIQQVGGDRSRLPSQYAQLLLLRTLIAVPVVLGGTLVGATARPTPEATFALVAMVLTALLETYAHGPRAVAGVLRRQSTVAVVLVVQRLVTAGAAAMALLLGAGLVGMTSAYLLVTAVGTVALFIVIARAGGRPSWRGLTRSRLWHTARQSVPLGVDALVAMMLFRIDAVMLEWFHGDTAVAEYTVPYRLVETVLFVTWAVSRVTFPAMAAANSRSASLRALESGLASCAFFFVPYAALLLVRGEDLLGLLFGEYYADSGVLVLQVLAPTPVFFAVGFLFSYAFVARGASNVALTTSVIAAVVNVLANLALLPSLSILGAAITTTGSYALEALLLIVIARRVFGSAPLWRPMWVPIVASLPAAAVGLLPIPLLPALLAFGVVYLLLWLLLARRWQPEHEAVLRSTLLRGRSR